MLYRSCGASELALPVIAVSLRHVGTSSFPFRSIRDFCSRALESGISHFDLTNNAGPPPGAVETMFGAVLRTALAGQRERLVIATRAGRSVWNGPYGAGGSRKHLIASLDQSLKRLAVDYVDIFYAERPDDPAELAETASALDTVLQRGKAKYVGMVLANARLTTQLSSLLRERGVQSAACQMPYSLLDRRLVRRGLLDVIHQERMGCVVSLPLASGLLKENKQDRPLTEEGERRHQALDDIARLRGQTLPQMALSWALRDERVTSALIEPDDFHHLEAALAATSHLSFTASELDAIAASAFDLNVGDWRSARA